MFCFAPQDVDNEHNIENLYDKYHNMSDDISNIYECDECGSNLSKDFQINKLVCDSVDGCGAQYDINTCQNLETSIDSSKNNYNTCSNLSFNIIVNGNKRLKKLSIQSSAKYEKTQRRVTYKQVKNIGETNLIYCIPENLANETTNYFHNIQKKGIIVRKRVRLGLIAACFYVTCLANNLYISRDNICLIFGITFKYLSVGEKKLNEFYHSGIIDYFPFTTEYYTEKQLLTYFIKINSSNKIMFIDELEMINNKYYNFCLLFIKFLFTFRIKLSSQITTKIAASMYCLGKTQDNMIIKSETIDEICNINRDTYMKIVSCIVDLINTQKDYLRPMNRKIIHLFNKYSLDYKRLL